MAELPASARLVSSGATKAAVLIADVLSRAERTALEIEVREASWKFVEGSVEGRDEMYRQCEVLYSDIDACDVLLEKLRAWSEPASRALGLTVSSGKPSRIERQISRYKDGDFYKPHRDDEGPEVEARMLTYVYYFSLGEPAFEGGELVIHPAGEAVVIEPVDNSLVLFPSGLEHEVRPVRYAGQSAEAARYTVNGWLWRPDNAT